MNYFLIGSVINPEFVGIKPHISCNVGCNSTDNWSLEAADKDIKKK